MNSLSTGPSCRAIVTAGSTIGQIDAVRFVEQAGADYGAGRLDRFEMQNPFRGELGLRVAEALYRRGVEVVLLTRCDLLASFRHTLPERCLRGFRTFGDLEAALPALCAEVRPDLVWMAAAVSDWIPERVEGFDSAARDGKLDSSEETLRVVFRKTPKLLDRIRPLTGNGTTIVGFKLLVNVSPEQLMKRANEQLLRANTDYCVGNDFMQIREGVHPVQLFQKNGAPRFFSGAKEQTAEWLVDVVLSERAAKNLSGPS